MSERKINDLGASLDVYFSFDPDFVEFYKSYLDGGKREEQLKILGLHPENLDVPKMSYKFFKEGVRNISVDVNANVGETKTPNAYWAEVSKGVTKLNCFYLIWRYTAKLYGKEEASRLCSYILDGKLHFHDMSSPTKLGVPYCFGFASYNLAIDGRPWSEPRSRSPKRYDSFMNCLLEVIMEMSQEFAGAIATPDLALVYTWYLLKEFSKDEILNAENVQATRTRTLKYIIENSFQQFIFVCNNKFRVGGECVDQDTEVMTPIGFKKMGELKVGDPIFVWKNGKLGVERVKRVNIYEVAGPLNYYQLDDVRIGVTPHHRMVYFDDVEYKISYSSDLIDKGLRYSIPVAHHGVECKDLVRYSKKEIEDKACNLLVLDPYMFINASPAILRKYIDLFIESHPNGIFTDNEYLYTKISIDNKEDLNNLQIIAFMAGYSTAVKNNTLFIYKRKNAPVLNMYEDSYSGYVWCPTTDAGVVVYRKDGLVFISGNSPFVNVSAYDRKTFESVYGDLVFPDGTRAVDIYDCFDKVQRIWMEFFSKKDPTTGKPYRFPVFTISLFVNDNGEYEDPDFVDFVSKVNKEGLFNIYITNDTAKVCSCCRLQTDIVEISKNISIDSFGNGGVSLGSQRVVTVNLARVGLDVLYNDNLDLFEVLEDRLEAAKSLLVAHRYLVKKRIEKGMLKFFDIKWADLDRMFFNTIGIIGLNELLDMMGYDITTDEGIKVAEAILDFIKNKSVEYAKETKQMFNVEQIPGESAAVTLAKLDKLFYKHPYKLYANQFIPLWRGVDLVTRAVVDGKLLKKLSGGGISHLNVAEPLDQKQMREMLDFAAKCGLEHFAINPRFAVCENGHVFVSSSKECPICKSKIVDYITRIVGYFVSVDKDFNYVRRDWEFPKRKFFKKDEFKLN